MCAVSVIHDYMRAQVQPQQWTRASLDDLNEVLRILRKLDDQLGQRDCEDPQKAQWMREIEERLRKLEGKTL